MYISAPSIVSPLGHTGIEAYTTFQNTDDTLLRKPHLKDEIPNTFQNCFFGFVDEDAFLPQLPKRLIPQTDRSTKMALKSAQECIDQIKRSKIALEESLEATGIVTTTSFGGFKFGQRELQNLYSKGPGFVSAFQSFAWFYAVNTGQVSIAHGIKGPGCSVVADEIGAAPALLAAQLQLISEEATQVLVGATDSYLNPLALSSVDENDIHEGGKAAKDHFSLGEGAAFVCLSTTKNNLPDEVPVVLKSISIGQIYGDRVGATVKLIEEGLDKANISPGSVGTILANPTNNRQLKTQENIALSKIFDENWRSKVSIPQVKSGRLGSAGLMSDIALATIAISKGEKLRRFYSITNTKHMNEGDDTLLLRWGASGQVAIITLGPEERK